MKYLQTYEARVINNSWEAIKNEAPLLDNDTIRVYHGFYYSANAVQAVKYGLSGKTKAKRIYSYESGNNPKGLFVTTDFKVVNKFTKGIVMEFQVKVSDLEAPVWSGGRYFVQGDMTKSFKNEAEREEERLRVREIHSKSDNENIANSDRPELAASIFDSPESQALYIGDLNPNMIRAMWVNETLLFDNRINGEYVRYSRKEFMKKYGNKILKKTMKSDYRNQSNSDLDLVLAKNFIFKPNEDFSMDVALMRINKGMRKDLLISADDLKQELIKHPRLRATYLYPKQINQLKELGWW